MKRSEDKATINPFEYEASALNSVGSFGERMCGTLRDAQKYAQ
jgi:hypothetical protein